MQRFVDKGVKACFSGAGEDERQQDTDAEQVIFEAFALHATGPVHKKAILLMYGGDHTQKENDGGQGEEPGEQAQRWINVLILM